MYSPCTPGNVNIPLDVCKKHEERTCPCTRGPGHAGSSRRKIRRVRLSHRSISRAIDLSCRACGAGAGCWAWIPGRGTFGFSPPTSDKRAPWLYQTRPPATVVNYPPGTLETNPPQGASGTCCVPLVLVVSPLAAL